MKSIKYLLFVVAIGLFHSTCQKETTFIGKDLEGEFVEAEIGGERIRFTQARSIDDSTLDTLQEGVAYDHIFFERLSEDGRSNFTCRAWGWDFLRAELPLEMVRQTDFSIYFNFSYNQNSEIIFFNSTEEFSLTILGWDEENYANGTFSGTLYSQDSRAIAVQNGTFRVRIIR